METINDKEELFCDVVMKGGITSGIVYPRAIFELAKAYTFKNVGGTSAGAIAASLASAAEYRRRTDKTTAGFEELNNIPTQLSDGALQKLFQPQVHTWSLYKFALAFIGSSHCVLKALNVAVKLFAFPATWIGALFGAAALIYLYFDLGLRPWWVWLFLVLSFVSLILFLALLNIVVQALWAIPANLYGLCLGSGGKAKDKPLTDWLADRLKLIANKDLLTFNDLW